MSFLFADIGADTWQEGRRVGELSRTVEKGAEITGTL